MTQVNDARPHEPKAYKTVSQCMLYLQGNAFYLLLNLWLHSVTPDKI